MNEALSAALEYIEAGWSVIPMRADTKRPHIEWKEFQERLPTYEEAEKWWGDWPDALLAVVTGSISGIVIVDADNEEAEEAAKRLGFTDTPIVARTKRGRHFYWKHPNDGKWRGPRAGNNVRATDPDWPAVDGLDFRGDGSYALLPPSKNYAWEVQPGCTVEDDAPTWRDWTPPTLVHSDEFNFADLDLSTIASSSGWVSEWDRTAAYVRERYPTTLKLPSGSGNSRNARVLSYASECLLAGHWGDVLRQKCRAFMHEFFVHDLTNAEFEATCASVENMERRNHPERFNEAGEYIFKRGPSAEDGIAKVALAPEKRRLIFSSDADALLKASAARTFLIEPWLPPASITQVYGYSGHGKSLALQNMLYALAAGAREVGPFEITKPARVFYLDYENGSGTIGSRLKDLSQMFGDAKENFAVWAPFLGDAETEGMNLRTAPGISQLEGWLNYYKPDVVVIDTLRTAFSGLEEKDAAAWAPINRLAIRLRNAGLAVIMVHHANKPGESGQLGEAGSTNQLTPLELQLRVAQVYDDSERAKMNKGLFDGDYTTPVWPMLADKLPPDAALQMVLELRYGKVREWSELHDPVQWIGFGVSLTTDQRYLVSSTSSKQKARALHALGHPTPAIAASIRRSTRVVSDWLAPLAP